MEEFVRQFGIDSRLLLSQVVNFAIVLAALQYFAYKPVAKILKERRERIEDGLMKANEADTRLEEVQGISVRKLKEAEQKAVELLRSAEARAGEAELALLESSKKKGEVLLREAVQSIEAEREKTRAETEKEARVLVRDTVLAVTHLEPDQIDKALIEKALKQVKQS
jgi:F-type H+-transporting ATPase subunit b